MASFTDSITQFNPYVSQLPVDAMVKVGMQKQAQYDQGVQKIQSYIDNVAGLEILNDTDKSYLQSKLDQLGSKLTVIAGGDSLMLMREGIIISFSTSVVMRSS
jgi:hypothetical protein